MYVHKIELGYKATITGLSNSRLYRIHGYKEFTVITNSRL